MSIPFIDRLYVGWISPQGEFTMVDYSKHDEWAEKKCFDLGYDPDDRPKKYTCPITFSDWLVAKGWIRITYYAVCEHLMCHMHENVTPPKPALDKLYDLVVQARKKGHTDQADKLHEDWKMFNDIFDVPSQVTTPDR